MKIFATNRHLQEIGVRCLAGSALSDYQVVKKNQPVIPEKFTVVRPPADQPATHTAGKFRAQGGPQSPLWTGSAATPFRDEGPPRRPVSSPNTKGHG